MTQRALHMIPARLASVLLIALLALAACSPIADRRETEAEQAYPPEGQIIEVAGRKVHAVVTGRGPDLVLIHGAGGNTRDFTFSFVDRLKDHYRVIVFDRPGHGYTDRIGSNGATEGPLEQARFLQAAAARLGARRPIVLGHSYGGAVALAWALERPDSLSGLVVLSGATQPWGGALNSLYAINSSGLGAITVTPLISAFVSDTAASQVIASIFAPQRPPPRYADHIGVGLTTRRDTLRANAQQISALNRHLTEMSKRYGEIRVPTEVVHGRADRIVGFRIHGQPTARQIPGARLTALSRVGHMPHHAAPAQVIAAIDRAARRAGLR